MQRMFEGIVSSKEWRDRVCGGREFLLPLQGHWEGISRIDILHKVYSARMYSMIYSTMTRMEIAGSEGLIQLPTEACTRTNVKDIAKKRL